MILGGMTGKIQERSVSKMFHKALASFFMCSIHVFIIFWMIENIFEKATEKCPSPWWSVPFLIVIIAAFVFTGIYFLLHFFAWLGIQ